MLLRKQGLALYSRSQHHGAQMKGADSFLYFQIKLDYTSATRSHPADVRPLTSSFRLPAHVGGKGAEEVLGALAAIPRQAALNKLVLDGSGGPTDLEAVFALASGPGETAAAARANFFAKFLLYIFHM